HLVHAVLEALQIIAGDVLGVPDLDEARRRAMREMREGRRRAVSEISEDKTEILARRVGRDPHLAGEARLLRRLLHALPRAIVLPAVIDAADAVLLDPAEVNRRAAMRTPVGDDLRLAGRAAVERIILAHDAHRLGLAGRQVLAAVDRVPE